MLKISELINKFGEKKAREYLLDRFSKPEHLEEFASLFPNHIQYKTPEYQKLMYSRIADSIRLVIAAPRGSGKSTVTDIVVCAWFLLYCKAHFVLLISDTLSQAILHLSSLASELESNQKIRWLFGDVKTDTWASEMFVVRTDYGEAAIMARGAGQKIRGLKWRQYRPELVIIDDLENEELVESFARRKKLEIWFRFALLRALAKNAKIIYIGTVLHDRALLKRILDRDLTFGEWEIQLNKAIRADGTSFWQDKFPLSYLEAIRDNPTHPEYAGSLVFAQEYQHEPASEQDRIIKENWIIYYNPIEKDELWFKTAKLILAVDPAIEEDSKSSSEFCAQIWALDSDGHFWNLAIKHGRMDINKQVEELLELIKTWLPTGIGIESIAYQRVLGQLLKSAAARQVPPIYIHITELMTDKSKLRRMTLHSSKIQGGFVHFDKTNPETAWLVNQLLTFPAEPNDGADCMMLAFETNVKKKGRAFAKNPL